MADIATQILGVSGTQTRSGKTKFEVALANGEKYATFKPELAQKAQSLVGQPVTARVSVVQNGEWTNYNFDDVAPAGQAPASQLGFGQAAPTPPIPIAPAPKQGMSEEDKARITKLAVFGHATALVGALYQGMGSEAVDAAIADVERVAEILYSRARSHEQITPPSTPQGVAEFANAFTPGAVQVGPPETPPAPATALPWS